MVQARGSGERRTTRTTASARNDGDGLQLGRRQKPRPAGREPYGRGEPTPGGRPRFPGPLVARRYVPTRHWPRVRQRFTVRRRCREDVPNSARRLLGVAARGVIPVTFCGTPCLTCCRCLPCLLASRTALTPPAKPLGKPGLHHSHLPLLHGRAMASQAGRFVLRLLVRARDARQRQRTGTVQTSSVRPPLSRARHVPDGWVTWVASWVLTDKVTGPPTCGCAGRWLPCTHSQADSPAECWPMGPCPASQY